MQKDSSWLDESFSQFRLAVKRINDRPPSASFPKLTYVAYNSGRVKPNPRRFEPQVQGACAAGGDRLTSLTGAVHLIDVEKCNLLVGTGYSSEIPAAASFASVHHVPMISPGSTSVEYADKTLYPYLLRTVGSDKLQFDAFVEVARYFGWRRLGGLVQQSVYGLSQLAELQASVSKGGLVLWGQVLVQTSKCVSLHGRSRVCAGRQPAAASSGDRQPRLATPVQRMSMPAKHGHGVPIVLRVCAVQWIAPSPWTSSPDRDAG